MRILVKSIGFTALFMTVVGIGAQAQVLRMPAPSSLYDPYTGGISVCAQGTATDSAKKCYEKMPMSHVLRR